MNEQKIYSIYGCKKSKNGDRLNITIVSGQNEAKEFAVISVKLEGSKVAVKLDDKYGYVAIPLLQEVKTPDVKMPF